MTPETPAPPPKSELTGSNPSEWVRRFACHVPSGGRVLDLACGGGRHSRLFLGLGHPVQAADRDLSRLVDLRENATPPGRFETLECDLEGGGPFPFTPGSFAGVVVTNYLYRPILPQIVESIAPGGVLIYETFARGNEQFGRPSNPDFLLEPGELLEAVAGRLRVLAYEDLIVDKPKPAAIQRICAQREEGFRPRPPQSGGA
ncbi:class I SAM-dependent methyltransferase [Denitrobaculum tricleocarpae]|uniref:Class I SAM-dependent methyltransferase n=1 Tax=Denitrobaculum tricleocarpae TaxID=2591009 RepID=A0A545T7Q8_9PROT|nr:class I SAM-dependent methyltransferase [Denitrobaculum tricleocarpae]TQV73232.1 class I SAM-dependent methyltransferase [Denitrobaculum tricleocarpae]